MNKPLSDASPWIRASGLQFSHGSRPVLRGLDFELFPARHYVVAGPNGAGKSTLLDVLANLKPAGGGRLDIFGKAAGDYEPGELARLLALAPQEFRMNFSFTIREVVAMGRRPHLGRWGRLCPADHAIVEQAIAGVHLESLADRPVTALSGGERRRCVVARALAQKTPVLLLDEPSAGLDIAQALTVMALARKLAREGALVVTVSHDLNLAAAYADEILFLKDGRIAAAGPVAMVFAGDVLSEVYETRARVTRDDFTGGLSVSFRMEEPAAGFPQ